MPATATIKTRSIQAEALSAVTDRLINTMLLLEGVLGKTANSFKVAQNLGTDMNVKVGSGTAYDRAAVQGDNAGQGVYVVEHQNATQVLAVAAADATNPRIDIVILRVYDDPFDSSGNSYADLEVITGTPAGVPSAPAVPSSAIKLAEVAVAAGATGIVDANITDARAEAAASGLLQAARDLSTLSETRAGMLGFDDTNDELQVGLGASVASARLGVWSTYSPSLTASTTNPTLGSSPTQTGRFCQIGKLVVCQIYLAFGSSGAAAGSGTYRVSLPVSASASATFRTAMGSGKLVDASTGTRRTVVCRKNGLGDVELVLDGAAGIVTDAAPWVWANSDVITLDLSYEAA